MPTVLTISGLRVVIYLNDHRPAHVHIIGLYEHRLLIVHNRAIRTLIAAALTQFEAAMSAAICTVVQQEHGPIPTKVRKEPQEFIENPEA